MDKVNFPWLQALPLLLVSGEDAIAACQDHRVPEILISCKMSLGFPPKSDVKFLPTPQPHPESEWWEASDRAKVRCFKLDVHAGKCGTHLETWKSKLKNKIVALHWLSYPNCTNSMITSSGNMIHLTCPYLSWWAENEFPCGTPARLWRKR